MQLVLADIPEFKLQKKEKSPAAKGGKKGKNKGGKKKQNKDVASFDTGIDKKKWQGKVVTRFPPEPSGYLHIGHAKAIILNAEVAKQHGGKMLVRMDDTNPAKEKGEYEESIKQDIKALDVEYQQVTHTSDYFEFYIELVEKCIEAGHVYADETPHEEMKALRMKKLPSAKRDRSIAETKALWEEMKQGTEKGLACCLRIKLAYDSDNGTLRDPVVYRCNIVDAHHQTGRKYNVYPTYDFACPIVDSLEGVTHAMRSKEYNERNVQYQMIWDLACKGQSYNGKELQRVNIFQFSRMDFKRCMLSKRKLGKLVDEGKVSGWDDPRMPTVRGIKRRGMTTDALKQFCFTQGTSDRNNLQEWDKIWTINKKQIDPYVHRYQCTSSNSFAELVIEDAKAGDTKTTNLLPKDAKAGQKTLHLEPSVLLEKFDASQLKEGQEITLCQWGNVIIQKIPRDADGNLTGPIISKLNPTGSFKGTSKLTWVPKRTDNIEATLVELDYLITTPELPKADSGIDWKTVVTEKTWFETKVMLEPSAKNIKEGDSIQLLRRGYYKLDSKKDMRLIWIPDGKTKAASALGSATDKVKKGNK